MSNHVYSCSLCTSNNNFRTIYFRFANIRTRQLIIHLSIIQSGSIKLIKYLITNNILQIHTSYLFHIIVKGHPHKRTIRSSIPSINSFIVASYPTIVWEVDFSISIVIDLWEQPTTINLPVVNKTVISEIYVDEFLSLVVESWHAWLRFTCLYWRPFTIKRSNDSGESCRGVSIG